MELTAAIELIRNASFAQTKGVWADLGCGSGLFTYALARLLPEGSQIYAIDKSQVVLNQYPKPAQTVIHQQQADFITQELHVPVLDGILMANSFHYVKDKTALIDKLSKYLKDTGTFLLVEYNTDTANPWVPYPVSFNHLQAVFAKSGYTSVTKLGERPSIYHRANIYAAYISR